MQIPFNYIGPAGNGLIPADPEKTAAFATTYDATGDAAAGVVVTFRQVSAPAGVSTGSYLSDSFDVASGVAGLLQVELLRRTRYYWKRGRQDGYFTTADATTYAIPLHLGRPA